ncbi:MAG: rhodanese-like domain-containing protein [Clostridiales bacterium]|nr:rhodanese-like domain-containing protein [Clostridiales bacterium]
MKKTLILITLLMVILTGCTGGEQMVKSSYATISAAEAKAIIDENDKALILDVRTPEEFEEGHLENALLIPDYELDARAKDELADKNALILVYCRSGIRSAAAAENLAAMGYTNIYDMGGIIDWPYETVG